MMNSFRQYFSQYVLIELLNYFGDICISESDYDFEEADKDTWFESNLLNYHDYGYDSDEPLYGGVSDDWEEYRDMCHLDD